MYLKEKRVETRLPFSLRENREEPGPVEHGAGLRGFSRESGPRCEQAAAGGWACVPAPWPWPWPWERGHTGGPAAGPAVPGRAALSLRGGPAPRAPRLPAAAGGPSPPGPARGSPTLPPGRPPLSPPQERGFETRSASLAPFFFISIPNPIFLNNSSINYAVVEGAEIARYLSSRCGC